jgi:superfamily II DNA or RNA helicase
MTAREQWQAFLGDLDAWTTELDAAAKSKDHEKQRAGRMLRQFFTGGDITRRDFTYAVYVLNGALLFRVNWAMLEGGK